MDIRKFESFHLQDALKLVKSELGKDAVIISTREKNVFSEKLGKNCKVYEVTAAPNIKESPNIIPAKVGEHLQKVEFPKVASKNEVTVVKGAAQFQKKPPIEKIPEPKYKQHEKESFQNQAEALSQLNPEIEYIKTELNKVKREIENLPHFDVAEKIQELKVVVHDLMREKFRQNIDKTNIHISDILIKLKTAGVSELILNNLNSYLETLVIPSSEDDSQSVEKIREFFLTSTIKYLFKNIKVTGSLFSNKQQRIMCFVGPTGAGKTTTIAKMAARLKTKDDRNIECVSFDSSKVSGANELRVYSKIINCHFSEASEASELIGITSKKNKFEVMFIDTPGISQRSKANINLLKEISQLPLPIEFHVVLSANMKQRDIDEIIKQYNFLNISSIIFNKLDESWAYGEILNTAFSSKISLSYFGNGQGVPEDIEIVSKEKVLEKLLKL